MLLGAILCLCTGTVALIYARPLVTWFEKHFPAEDNPLIPAWASSAQEPMFRAGSIALVVIGGFLLFSALTQS